MTDRDSAPSSADGRKSTAAWIMAGLLIVQFLYRLSVAAHEYPRPTERFMTIGFDILCLVGVVLYRNRIPQPVYWGALGAGIGMFVIRMRSPESWATGHWDYSLLLR
jgi:hypothetical protein